MPLPTDPSPGALAGIRVLDCGQLIAGGMVGMLLADFGADVIKVEHPVGGDPLRSFGRRRGTSPLYWRFLARNKRSITLALNTPDGQTVFRRLVAATNADIVIESFRPGTMERWGLGQEVLEDIRPGLILVRLSGFGQTGPYRERPGFGTLAEAMSGFAEMTGQADGPPTLPPIALANSVAALYATVGVMVALRARDAAAGGHGQTVDASLARLPVLAPGQSAHRVRPARHRRATRWQSGTDVGAAEPLPHSRRSVDRDRRTDQERVRPSPADARPGGPQATTLASPPTRRASPTSTPSMRSSRRGFRLGTARTRFACSSRRRYPPHRSPTWPSLPTTRTWSSAGRSPRSPTPSSGSSGCPVSCRG